MKLSVPQYLHLVIISINSVCLQGLFRDGSYQQFLAHSRCLVKVAILPPNLFIYLLLRGTVAFI